MYLSHLPGYRDPDRLKGLASIFHSKKRMSWKIVLVTTFLHGSTFYQTIPYRFLAWDPFADLISVRGEVHMRAGRIHCKARLCLLCVHGTKA